MGKRLSDNLSSRYFGAANQLRPKKSRKRIVAYVESYDDVLFWRSLLSEFEDETRFFQVMLPSSTSLAKGKKTVLMNQLGPQLGANMIACVDSDYDYLIQGATSTSRQIIESPYVMQTYVYAIENYQCYAEGLHEVCVMVTLNDNMIIDFSEFLKTYSQIAYPLFLWSVWLYKKHILNVFPMMEFCGVVKLDYVDIMRPEESLSVMQRRVDKSINWLHNKYRNMQPEVDRLGEEIKELGVTSDNTYLYIQGHHIFDNVVMKLLDPVCKVLRKQREKEIHNLAEHGQQLYNELTCYEHSQSDLVTMLKKSSGYKNSSQYQKMRQDVTDFLKTIV